MDIVVRGKRKAYQKFKNKICEEFEVEVKLQNGPIVCVPQEIYYSVAKEQFLYYKKIAPQESPLLLAAMVGDANAVALFLEAMEKEKSRIARDYFLKETKNISDLPKLDVAMLSAFYRSYEVMDVLLKFKSLIDFDRIVGTKALSALDIYFNTLRYNLERRRFTFESELPGKFLRMVYSKRVKKPFKYSDRVAELKVLLQLAQQTSCEVAGKERTYKHMQELGTAIRVTYPNTFDEINQLMNEITKIITEKFEVCLSRKSVDLGRHSPVTDIFSEEPGEINKELDKVLTISNLKRQTSYEEKKKCRERKARLTKQIREEKIKLKTVENELKELGSCGKESRKKKSTTKNPKEDDRINNLLLF